MKDLIAELERAEVGSRELDVLIWAAMDDRDVRLENNVYLAQSRRAPHDTCRLGAIDPGKHQRNFHEAYSKPPFPNYTTSRDAARTLVSNGRNWDVRELDGQGAAEVFHTSVGAVTYYAKTGILALCIAALKARQENAK